MPIFMFNYDEPLLGNYANKAKREFRKMNPVSLELQNNGYVEIRYCAKNGSEAVIRFKELN